MSRTFYNITYKGKRYKAIPNPTKLCTGCSFIYGDEHTACAVYKYKHACTPISRKDGNYIIWIEVK